MAEEGAVPSFETLVSLCKRRGFVFPGSEIYGGIGGFWDYGPLGGRPRRGEGGVSPRLSHAPLP